MSFLIKGVEMPSKCRFCPCCADNGLIGMQREYFCSAVDSALEIDNLDQKLSCCPLVEIPTPHGRLIDADKAATSISMMNNHPCGNSIETVNDVVEWLRFANDSGNNIAFPTILEAEEK